MYKTLHYLHRYIYIYISVCVCVCIHTLRATQAEARWGEVGKIYPHPITLLGRGKPVWSRMG